MIAKSVGPFFENEQWVELNSSFSVPVSLGKTAAGHSAKLFCRPVYPSCIRVSTMFL